MCKPSIVAESTENVQKKYYAGSTNILFTYIYLYK